MGPGRGGREGTSVVGGGLCRVKRAGNNSSPLCVCLMYLTVSVIRDH